MKNDNENIGIGNPSTANKQWFQHPNPIEHNFKRQYEEMRFFDGMITVIKKKLGKATRKEQKPHIKAIIYHCMLSTRSNRPIEVSVKDQTALRTVLQRMEDLELIVFKEGRSNVAEKYSYLSKYQPTPKFIQALCRLQFQLSDIEHPRVVNVKGSVNQRDVLDDSTKDGKAITQYNEYIKQQRIECMFNPDDFGTNHHFNGFTGTFELNSQISRIYTNHEGEGGRLYNQDFFRVQELPKAVRERITINESPTDELDFKSLHATMLYHMKGLNGLADAYDLFPDVPDRWTLRKCVKLAFNRIINSANWNQAKGSVRECFNKENPELGKTLKQHFKTAGAEDDKRFIERLLLIIVQAHQPIKEYFCSGIWKELQRIDANIMLLTISHLRSMDIPALPVHDSIIVRKQDATVAHEVMLSAYKTGFRQNIIIEGVNDAA